MKKLGILTLPIKTNYGGILQVYALQTFLKSLGYDAWFIKRRWNSEGQSLLHKVAKSVYHAIVIRKFNAFINKYIIPQTEVIDTAEKAHSLMDRGFDTFIVGSDQVWRMRYVYGVGYNYFLDFTKGHNVKRISYAASFGVDYWDDDTPDVSLPEVKLLLQEFDAVSVRESSGCELCRKLFGINALRVLDPTLLLDKTIYINNLHLKTRQKRYLGVYILDENEEKDAFIRESSKILSLPIKYINNSAFTSMLPSSIAEMGKPGVRSWLKGIAEAEFIITDSFHGTAFSIIFEKQFWVIGNEHRGNARFESLLDLFGIRERLVNDTSKMGKSLYEQKIDYTKVNILKRSEQEKAKAFIRNNIE